MSKEQNRTGHGRLHVKEKCINVVEQFYTNTAGKIEINKWMPQEINVI